VPAVAVTPDESVLWKAIDVAPGDMLPLCILADWFEEHGRDDEAECLRWAAREMKEPWPSAAGKFWWFDQRAYITSTRSTIPGAVCEKLKTEEFVRYAGWWHLYQTRVDAYRDLCRAWLDCRAAGLNPLTGEKLP